MIRVMAVALALCLSGCDSETGAQPEEVVEVEAPEEPIEEPDEEEEPEPEEEEEEGPPPVTTAQPGDAEGSSCRQAFAGVANFRERLIGVMGDEPPPALDRDAYIESCETLPPAAQRCMIMRYQMTHHDECAQYRAQIDELSRAGQ